MLHELGRIIVWPTKLIDRLIRRCVYGDEREFVSLEHKIFKSSATLTKLFGHSLQLYILLQRLYKHTGNKNGKITCTEENQSNKKLRYAHKKLHETQNCSWILFCNRNFRFWKVFFAYYITGYVTFWRSKFRYHFDFFFRVPEKHLSNFHACGRSNSVSIQNFKVFSLWPKNILLCYFFFTISRQIVNHETWKTGVLSLEESLKINFKISLTKPIPCLSVH